MAGLCRVRRRPDPRWIIPAEPGRRGSGPGGPRDSRVDSPARSLDGCPGAIGAGNQMCSQRCLEEQNTLASTLCPAQSARQWGVIPRQTTLVTLCLVYGSRSRRRLRCRYNLVTAPCASLHLIRCSRRRRTHPLHRLAMERVWLHLRSVAHDVTGRGSRRGAPVPRAGPAPALRAAPLHRPTPGAVAWSGCRSTASTSGSWGRDRRTD